MNVSSTPLKSNMGSPSSSNPVKDKGANAAWFAIFLTPQLSLIKLAKSPEAYIHWPNRAEVIEAQLKKIVQITRGK